MSVTGINYVAFNTPDIARLRSFYIELLGAEPLTGDHEPIRVGHTLIVFFKGDAASDRTLSVGFDADADTFKAIAAKADGMGALERGPVDHTPVTKGLFLRDPDGRHFEVCYNDLGVFWQN
jgi:catechol 2,3-dioxygenase-like lactoylglutathione lyase family enzyme